MKPKLSRFERLRRTALCGLAGLALVAAKPVTPPAVIRVACVGDSLTEGFPLKHPDKDAYPARLGRILGPRCAVKNFGAGGTTALQSGDHPFTTDFRHFYEKAKELKPNVVVLMLGTNDSKPVNFAHQDDFARDLGKLVDDFASVESKPAVYLCLPPPAFSGAYDINNDNLDKLAALIRQVATDKNVPLIDVRTAMKDQSKDFPDGIHPNEQGAEIIARTVASAIKPSVTRRATP